jgi:condensin complex subunit 1
MTRRGRDNDATAPALASRAVSFEANINRSSNSNSTSKFPIPSSLQDLEHAPYNLFPYPTDFKEDDEATRAESFDALVDLLEAGNGALSRSQPGLALFENEHDNNNNNDNNEWTNVHNEAWMSDERIQALYTLVRKATSLASKTRSRFLDALCQSILSLCHILSTSAALDTYENNKHDTEHDPDDTEGGDNNDNDNNDNNTLQRRTQTDVMPQSFRDALACHLYMLYSAMSAMESEVKVNKGLGLGTMTTAANNKNKKGKGSRGKKNNTSNNAAVAVDFVTGTPARHVCATAMRQAAKTMAQCSHVLWQRGVAEEDIVTLPCRVAYLMIENSHNATARKASCGDDALHILAVTIRHNHINHGGSGTTGSTSSFSSSSSCPSIMTTLVAAIMDLMHSAEHIAPMMAELCVLAGRKAKAGSNISASVSSSPSSSSSLLHPLPIELLREFGRLEVGSGDNSAGSAQSTAAAGLGGKASGIKYVAPFLSELAARLPHLVLGYFSLIMNHLQSEPYVLRSAIATAISHILVGVRAEELNERERGDGHGDGHGHSTSQSQEHGTATNNSNDAEEQAAPGDAPKTHTIHGGLGAHSKTREGLIDILLERSLDVSSFTRSAVLKAWIFVIQNDALPVSNVMAVTSIAIDRLQDKTVLVRRNAMQLLTLVLENNPFMGSLCPDPYKAKAHELDQYLRTHIPHRIKSDVEEALKAERKAEQTIAEEDDNDANSTDAAHPHVSEQEIQDASLAYVHKTVDAGEDLNLEENSTNAEFFNKLQAFRFSTSALKFISLFEHSDATHALDSMLLSSNASDVTEAIRFFVRAKQFELPCAVTGMKQALSLMWSTEPNIVQEVLTGFMDVFVAVPGSGTEGGGGKRQEYLPNEEIVLNLISLVSQASVSEMASIEEAISRLVKEERIPAEVFLMLWAFVAKANAEARSASMLLISMGASANPTIVDSASRLRLLLEVGLGDQVEESHDWEMVRCAACALQQIGRAQDVDPEGSGSAKAIVLELIVERLTQVMQGLWCRDGEGESSNDNSENENNSTEHNNNNKKDKDTNQWFSAAEQVIDAVFVFASKPEEICSDVLRNMMTQTFFMNNAKGNSSSDLQLARLFFVAGHVALKLLVYTEALGASITRANAAKNLKTQEAADKAKTSTGSRTSGTKNMNDSADADSHDNGNGENALEIDMEEELELAAEREADHDRNLTDICEQEIVGRGILGLFEPLLVRVISDDSGQYSASPILIQSATLSLCKMMCISSGFCEKNLDLLFGTLEHPEFIKDTTLRANLSVAMGDLAFRFPNALEPYTPKIYACLRDTSDRVRRHTMMVLTHLILNDMVKVKTQMVEIALCLEDSDPRIRDMARLLFSELSKRSNSPIYNLLPDIISRLSQSDQVTRAQFKSIMGFLIGFIKKDKQNEVLMDKICHRFASCSSMNQKTCLAFCLSSLKLNERSIKILNDNFKCFKDALFDEEVFKSFASIATKAKSFMKPETKQQLDEFEAKLKEENQKGLENYKANTKAKRATARRQQQTKNKQQATSAAAAKKTQAAKNNPKDWEGASDEDEEESDEDSGSESDSNSNSDAVEDKENVSAAAAPKTKASNKPKAATATASSRSQRAPRGV